MFVACKFPQVVDFDFYQSCFPCPPQNSVIERTMKEIRKIVRRSIFISGQNSGVSDKSPGYRSPLRSDVHSPSCAFHQIVADYRLLTTFSSGLLSLPPSEARSVPSRPSGSFMRISLRPASTLRDTLPRREFRIRFCRSQSTAALRRRRRLHL